MINCITTRLENNYSGFRKIGRKVFDIPELNAKAYLRKVGNNDTLTVLDKNQNLLYVENKVQKTAGKQEIFTQFFGKNGELSFSIKSTVKKVS